MYSNKFAVFEQSFPDGADATAVVKVHFPFSSNVNSDPFTFISHIQGDVSSCFPSINPTVLDNQPRGFVSWQGRFLEASRGGVWQQGSGSGSPGVATGGSGGPFVVFNSDMTDSLVFSPASNFMTNTAGMSPVKEDGSFCFGLDGPVTSVPPGYSLETMVYLGSGVNSVMKEFGTTLLNKFQTVRPEDYTTKWLGYSTGRLPEPLRPVFTTQLMSFRLPDNGAYFYYVSTLCCVEFTSTLARWGIFGHRLPCRDGIRLRTFKTISRLSKESMRTLFLREFRTSTSCSTRGGTPRVLQVV